MEYNSLEDFIKINEKPAEDICPKCKNKVELVFLDYEIQIENILIEVIELPQLECTTCSNKLLTEKSKRLILFLNEKCKRYDENRFRFESKGLEKRYKFAEKFNFKYDYRDYENIPGLHALTGDGFLTPVYFTKEALIYFMHHPNYELNIFSETYGIFGYSKGLSIPFGINKNDKLIIWLGDLDRLNDNTLEYLKIHNINSDHTIINTEFYDAQINSEWSEPITEIKIVNYRNKLYDLLKFKHGLDLHFLDKEVITALDDIKKPITYSENEIKPVISGLHKILIEAVDKEVLRKYYEEVKDNKDPNYKKWGSIKYYDFLLSRFTLNPTKDLIAPLYLLNDLRNIFFHLLSSDEEEKLKQNIIASLKISNYDLKVIYNQLMLRLIEFYREFIKVL